VDDATSPSVALAQPWPLPPLSGPNATRTPLRTQTLDLTRAHAWQRYDGTEPRSTRHQPRLSSAPSFPSLANATRATSRWGRRVTPALGHRLAVATALPLPAPLSAYKTPPKGTPLPLSSPLATPPGCPSHSLAA
jgi:hypothetical protein